MKKCIIISASPVISKNIKINKEDFVIVCDGGYDYVKKHNIKFDLLIGDFDSLNNKISGDNVITLKKEKDETDTLAAINYAIKKQFDEFYLYGCSQGKTDHFIANIQVLNYLLKNNKKGYIIDDEQIIFLIKNESINLNMKKGRISIFSFNEIAKNVSIKNLKYELNNYTLTNFIPLGVSNEFIDKEAIISVDDGVLLIIIERNI